MRLLLKTVSIRFGLALALVNFDSWHFLLQFIQFLLRIKQWYLFILFGVIDWSLLCVIIDEFLVIILNDSDCFGLCLWQSVKSLWYFDIKWGQKLFLIIFYIVVIIFINILKIIITFRNIFVIGWNGGYVPS